MEIGVLTGRTVSGQGIQPLAPLGANHKRSCVQKAVPSARGFATRPLDQPGGEGLAARLTDIQTAAGQ